MRLHVRARLTLWYVTVLLGALVLFAGVATWSAFASLRSGLDERLVEAYEYAEDRLRVGADGGVEMGAEVAPDDGETTAPWVEVTFAGDKSLYRSANLPPSGIRGLAITVEPHAPLRPATFSLPDGTAARGACRQEIVGGTPVWVRVAFSEEPIRAQVTTLAWKFLLALPLAGLFAGAGGWWVAGRALAPVDRAFAELRRFTADASHELRTPLTALRAVGEVGLREERTPAEYREVLGSMLEETDRLARLVDSLLVLSRADSGRLNVTDRVDLGELARDVVDHLQVLAEEKRQTFEVHAHASAFVVADRDALRRAVINLVDNAIKYAPVEGRIDVTTRERDGSVALEVHDNGPGVAPEHVPHVFDRFYRIDPARSRETGGAGLGLAIARAVVESHGGRIELETQTGRGATFRVVLPRADKPKEAT